MNARLGLALLLLSAPCWWIGAFASFPVLGEIYTAPDSATQVRIVSNHPTAWLAQNLCFLLGLLAATVGLAVLTPILRSKRGWRFAQLGLLTTMAATAAGVGAEVVRRGDAFPPLFLFAIRGQTYKSPN